PKLFLKKSISASNFEFTILFILKAIKKLPSISAIELINTDIISATNKINFGYYEKLFRHFGFGNDHLLREAISANIYSLDASTMCKAAQVSKNWRNIVGGNGFTWKKRLLEDGLVLRNRW